jgi:transposase
MAAMTMAVAELPDDVDALKAMIIAMAGQKALLEARTSHLEVVNKTADERIATLTAIVRMLERSRYGTRSERLRGATLSDEQHAFVFDEIKTGLAAIEAELESTAQDKPKRAQRSRKGFAADLERIEIVIEPEIPADCDGLEKVLIGEDVSERLDVMRAKFRVIVTRRPKYAYRNRDGVIQAPAPPHIIESGIPTEALLAQIAVSKYADGLPLYRQEAIYARDQVELDRSLMAQWMGKVGFELQPLADYVLERIKQGERVFADETTLPTLAPGSGKTQKAWLWAYARDDRPFGGAGPPMVAYRFEDSRSGDCVARHLKGYTGILQVDGYSAYTRLAKTGTGSGNETVTLAGCWAHLRRRFYELHINGSSLWPRFGRLKVISAALPRQRAWPPVSSGLPPLWRSCSISGKWSCRASRGSRSWPRPSAMPRPGAKLLNASSSTAALRWIPTSSSGRSGLKQSRARTRCSRAATAAAGHGQLSPPSCRPRK